MKRLLPAALGLLFVSPLSASTATVTSNADAGPGTLREAVEAGVDTVLFDPSVTWIVLTSGPLAPISDLTVTGHGRYGLSISGGGTQRVFEVRDVDLNLHGLTLRDGFTSGLFVDPGGGGIFARRADLHLFDVQVTHCAATIGGGIYLEGGCRLHVDSSFFIFNEAGLSGGAIGTGAFNNHVLLERSAFEDNEADEGAAFDHGNGELLIDGCLFEGNVSSTGTGFAGAVKIGAAHGVKRIRNTTFFGNTGYRGAGLAITALGTRVDLRHNTIVKNTGTRGSGLFIGADSVLFANNIVADNVGGRDVALLVPMASTGWNLVGVAPPELAPGPFDQFGTDSIPRSANPGLLGPNGGPVRTVPIACSPTVNAGNPAFSGTATDARGLPRAALGAPDLGAYELQRGDIDPSNLLSSAGVTAALQSWDGTLGVDFYQVFTRSLDGTENVVEETPTTGHVITGLTPGTTYRWKVRPACDDGQFGRFSEEDTFTTGVFPARLESPAALEVFPNPAREAWTVQGISPGVLRVVDASGRTIRAIEVHDGGTVRVDAARLPPGVYALISGERTVSVVRIP